MNTIWTEINTKINKPSRRWLTYVQLKRLLRTKFTRGRNFSLIWIKSLTYNIQSRNLQLNCIFPIIQAKSKL